MKPAVLLYTIFATVAVVVGILIPLTVYKAGSNTVPSWEGLINPGPVSKVHQFIATQCETCHRPLTGVTANNCITCHTLTSSADRQSTRFHVAATQCTSCHVEHGENKSLSVMDHRALTRPGFWTDTVAEFKTTDLVIPMDVISSDISLPQRHSDSNDSMIRLNCSNCHSNRDPHRARFGAECGSCHTTETWIIKAFQHPPEQTSKDCNECHKAPPSHYMMHFEMVSQSVAHQNAPVEHCYSCHTTDAWNNIRGVGWYKHH